MIKNLPMNEVNIEAILKEAAESNCRVPLSNVVECIFVVFEHVYESELYKNFEQDHNFDNFMSSLLVSLVATITENFSLPEA